MSTARGQAQARWSPSAGYADPGSIAVARGLARRDADGSVVFDLSAPSVPPEPPPPRYEEPAAWQAAPGSWHAVQRQEPAAEPAGAPAPSADSEQTPVTMIPPASAASAATPAATAGGTTGAHPASGAASTPLDELARQLFGPLSARLKAELRLDRERAGLLTDLR